jgi:uncharacterized protein YdhG (YjbR/CyaY superfamily)
MIFPGVESLSSGRISSPEVAMTKPRDNNLPPSRSAATIDAYLAGVADDRRRATLERLRRTIRAAARDAIECISYGMPAFRVGGRVVAGFQATARGGSYYPFSGSTLDALGDALAGFGRTKSAIHFTVDAPLPPALVRKLVRARIAELPRAALGRPRPSRRRG